MERKDGEEEMKGKGRGRTRKGRGRAGAREGRDGGKAEKGKSMLRSEHFTGLEDWEYQAEKRKIRGQNVIVQA